MSLALPSQFFFDKSMTAARHVITCDRYSNIYHNYSFTFIHNLLFLYAIIFDVWVLCAHAFLFSRSVGDIGLLFNI